MAFVFMITAMFLAGGWRKAAALPSLLMLLVFRFCDCAARYHRNLRSQQGISATFGESGSNAYARLVAGQQTLPFSFYSLTPPSYLKHPLNLIYHAPDVYEFSRPFNATYPLWYEISYWDAGYKARFDPGAQLRVLNPNLKDSFP